MKVIVFGATGMVGQGVLRECLLASDVEQVLAVGRRPTGVRHPKLREASLTDFTDLAPIKGELAGYDACFYCLGVSSVGMKEAEYSRISYDFPIAAARTLAELNPEMTFIYVSGAGTNPQGRQMWQRVKGRTENAVIEMFPRGFAARPGIIRPTHGVRSRVGWYNTAYTLVAPLLGLLDRVAPGSLTSTDRLGRALLRVARDGADGRVLGNRDLR